MIAAFLLTNKVWSPQYSLWLVPLAVLALPHRRMLLAWMTIDALVWVPRMYYYLGVGNKGLPEQWFTATVVLRDLAVVGAVRADRPADLPSRRRIWCAAAGWTTRSAGCSTAPRTGRRGGCRPGCIQTGSRPELSSV